MIYQQRLSFILYLLLQIQAVTSDTWDRPYSRKEAAYPLPGQEKYKFWPSVSRINNAYGDRNLICSCPSVKDLEEINSL